MSRLAFWESTSYPSLRKIRTNENVLFLTFDDGPNPQSTPRVLDVLKKHDVTATFFIIANKAQAQLALVERIKNEGHAIGNHSLDHAYSAFFSGRATMTEWIQQSVKLLGALGIRPVGFRPPAGVRTPQLYASLEELQIPLIMWQHRFYDTNLKWTLKRALGSLDETKGGDIVLLHDSQRPKRIGGFLETLENYIVEAKRRGFILRAMTADDCRLSKQ